MGHAIMRGKRVTQIIVAIDGYSFEEAENREILAKVSSVHAKQMVWGVKISDMLYGGNVPAILSSIKSKYNLSVMVDVKLHDIPSAVENSLARLVDLGADIVTVHCSSNFRPSREDLLEHIAGATLPSSLTNLETKLIYGREPAEMVRDFADLAQINRYAYLFGSVQGLKPIEDTPLKKICTGIRPHWYTERHDQVRVDSVKEAVRLEADFIVVGRPITHSPDIIAAIEKIHEELD
jgi:orotidine-5'-phosphate decarboxylase